MLLLLFSFWCQKASCRNYLACQKVSLDAILEASLSALVLQFTEGYDLWSSYSQKSYHKII